MEGPAPTGAAWDGARGERGEAIAALALRCFPLTVTLVSTVVLTLNRLYMFGL